MAQFVDTIKDVGKNYGKYDKWEQEQADKKAQKAYLVKHLNVPNDKLELTKKKAETIIRATEIMDARSEDNCENMEQVMGMVQVLPTMLIPFAQIPAANILEKSFKMSAQKAAQISTYGSLGLMFATMIGLIFYGNSKQKEASRIGRYQAKNFELKGLENFINYTPEQLEQAEKIAQNLPDKKEKKGLAQAIEQIKYMQKDKSAYKKWAKTRDPNELTKLKNRNISAEELKKAKEDKELITNTVSEINIKAEEYSENLENAFDTVGTLSFLIAAPLGFVINKILKLAKVSKKANVLTSVLVPAMTALGIQMAGTMEQKQASRIGRHHARKEILNDPSRLMVFTDEEMALAKNIKAPEQKVGLFEKIGRSFKFLKSYYKDKKDYKDYKETTQKHKEKLQEAFKHIETTEAQKKEAKKLQTNVFRAFDEVDEMSQRYSEDVEAGTEMAKQTLSSLWGFGTTIGLAALSVGIVKGKISLVKPLKWITNLAFDSKSTLGNSLKHFCETLSKSKNGKREFQKALFGGSNKLKPFLENPNNVEIKKSVDGLMGELKKLGTDGLSELGTKGEKNAGKIFQNLMQKHFKQTRMAKWARGLMGDSFKIWAKNNLEKNGIELTKEMQESMGLNFNYKNYKTLINTSAVAGLPVLGIMFSVPYIINSWLTDIQKKAGKIGIMKAMEKIDDPRVFAEGK